MASLVAPSASLARVARPIYGEDELDQLLDLVLASSARVVMLGAASYGTHEHFDLRASLTRKLLVERGFAAVVIEADWPDALRVDRYVRNQSDDDGAEPALAAFDHFPAWAWRNTDVERFVEWLRIQNCCRPATERIGFYGLDVYSLNAALRAMRTHVDASEEELVAELVDMQWRHAARSGRAPSGVAWLHAMQSSYTVEHATAYYQMMLAGGDAAWRLHGTHMADTIEMLAKHVGTDGIPAKLVVWAHDGQVGDARGVVDGSRSSLGQCMRERLDEEVALIGFTTYQGTVRCAPAWDAESAIEPLLPAAPGSWEALFHETSLPRFLLTSSALRRAVGEHATRTRRTIGAIRRAEPYVSTRLAEQFDLIVHVDTTRAVMPLVEASSADETHAMADVSACAD
jgi:erythromycin esterase-like protein